MNSMYRGKQRFDREQLVFVAEVMITSMVDAVESHLPQYPAELVEWTPQRQASFDSFYNGANESLGWNLSIFYAQLTGDGTGVGDALHVAAIDEPLSKLIKQRTSKRWKGLKEGGKIHNINTRKLAEKFVDAYFNSGPKDYLQQPPIHDREVAGDELG